MDFATAVKTVLVQKYVKFDGRASRSEFWWFTLFSFIVSAVLYLVDGVLGIDLLRNIYSLAVLLPTLAVGARRLHDIGKSGWWQLLIITLIGILVLIYWWVQPSEGENQHGPTPAA